MGIDNYNFSRKSLQKNNETIRGTNQSSGRSVGPRGNSKGIEAGGLTGGGIGFNAINTDQMGNVQKSTHLNLQHSILPLVSDATIAVQTFSSPNYTADIQIYGVGGATTVVSVYRPDKSILLCHPAGGGTGWDLGHDFVTAQPVYVQIYFDVFFDGSGNGRFVAVWKNTPFTAIELAEAFKDGRIPFLSTPGNTNTRLTTGTSGSFTNNMFGPAVSSGGAGTAGITSVSGTLGPSITVGSSDSSIIITPAGNNIDLQTTTHGTVTNVTAASPLSSSGGTTPNITFTGIQSVTHGGTGVDLSATGGTSFVLKQITIGGNISVAQLAFTDISGIAIAGQIPNLDTAKITTGTFAAARLPNPSATTLGGIQSIVAIASNWINSISTAGVPTLTQPAFTDISGTAISGQIPNLNFSKITAGIVPISQGGTGVDLSATGAASNVLKQISSGATITVGQLAFTDISGTASTSQLPTVTAVKGGTGQTVYAVGDILYADTTTTLAKLPDVATGSVLTSSGVSTAPAWSVRPILSALYVNTDIPSSPLGSANCIMEGNINSAAILFYMGAKAGNAWNNGGITQVGCYAIGAGAITNGVEPTVFMIGSVGVNYGLAMDGSFNVGIRGKLQATQVLSTGQNGSAGTLGYCPPVFLLSGAASASTMHIVSDSITAPAGVVTTVTFAGGCGFSDAKYNLLITNDTTFTAIAPATKLATGFTFTSVAGTIYTFTCIGV